MTALGEVPLKGGVLLDRITLEGNFLVITRFRRSDDPRDDGMVRSGIVFRLPCALWAQYRLAMDAGAEESDLGRALLPDRRP